MTSLYEKYSEDLFRVIMQDENVEGNSEEHTLLSKVNQTVSGFIPKFIKMTKEEKECMTPEW